LALCSPAITVTSSPLFIIFAMIKEPPVREI
jgi:hypothetical protein